MCEEKYYTLNEAISILIKVELEKQLVRAVKDWGIEGTEDKILKIYAQNPKLRDNMLNTLHKLYKF